MKLKSLGLIVIAFLVTALLPAINMIQGNIKVANLSSAKSAIEAAYKADYVTGWVNLARSKIGYSSDPAQAVIGTNGWMYLGDRHDKSISVNRGMLLPPEKHYRLAKDRRLLIDGYAKAAGARGAYFMIAPNKEEVYPEYLPAWAKANGKPTFSERFLKESDETLINLRPAMLLAKEKHQRPIYIKTDSHWNDLGAWEAYRDVAKKILEDHPDIRFLTESDIDANLLNAGKGGDISRFLFIDNMIIDARPNLQTKKSISIETIKTTSGETTYSGPNKILLSQSSPLLVKSDLALNSMRVLWLRDSFGNALSPFMAATFSETIQQHWRTILNDDKALKGLIESHKPDLVLFTIVGRSYFHVVNSAK